MASKSYAWLDWLVEAQAVVLRRAGEYQRTALKPDALIASPAWRRFELAVERRDALLACHLDQLLELAGRAVEEIRSGRWGDGG